ncbi:hypothetical protein DMENIID0001_084840 [Sergentomyia squamirostris]
MVEKSPVSVLQELCVQHYRALPIYEDLSTEFDNFSEYSVKVFGLEVTGRGSDIKEAKQVAAKKMLELIEDRNILGGKKEINAIGSFVNHIGALLEFCVQNRLEPPIFDYLLLGTTPDQPKRFLVKCRMGNIEVSSKDLSKKGAKHAAAKAMLDKIRVLAKDEKLEASNIPQIRETVSSPSDSERIFNNFSDEAIDAARMLLAKDGLDDKVVVEHVCKTLDIPWRQSHVTMADQEKEIVEIDFTYTYINIADSNKVFSNTKQYLKTILDNYSSEE